MKRRVIGFIPGIIVLQTNMTRMFKLVIVLRCIILVPSLLGDATISFPITIDNGGSNMGFSGTQQFYVPDGHHPLKALRHFCGTGVIGNGCLPVRDYLVQVLARLDPVALDYVLPSYVDDTIMTLPVGNENGYVLPSLLVWSA